MIQKICYKCSTKENERDQFNGWICHYLKLLICSIRKYFKWNFWQNSFLFTDWIHC